MPSLDGLCMGSIWIINYQSPNPSSNLSYGHVHVYPQCIKQNDTHVHVHIPHMSKLFYTHMSLNNNFLLLCWQRHRHTASIHSLICEVVSYRVNMKRFHFEDSGQIFPRGTIVTALKLKCSSGKVWIHPFAQIACSVSDKQLSTYQHYGKQLLYQDMLRDPIRWPLTITRIIFKGMETPAWKDINEQDSTSADGIL